MVSFLNRFIQLHILTVLGPSCVNRDDTGRPKTAVLGGVSRLRISSQSLKRAWRSSTVMQTLLDGSLGVRTQRLGAEIIAHLATKGVDAKKATPIAREIAGVFGKVKAENKSPANTEQLVFVSPAEMKAAFDYAEKLANGAKSDEKALAALIIGAAGAADIAMFGRMFADAPAKSIEAAVSVAHAVTANKAVVADDFYTAVDDLKTADEDAGAGFIGEAGFGSGVFYSYINIDVETLLNNLNGDVELAKKAIEGLVTAAATVQPNGKRSTFAHQTRASYVMAEIGSAAPRSLISAFELPVDRIAETGESLTAAAVRALRTQREQFVNAYGEQNATAEMFVDSGVGTLQDVVSFAVGAVESNSVAQLKAAE